VDYIKVKCIPFISVAVFLTVAGMYYYFILLYTINFPLHDDYHAVLGFLFKYTDASASWKDKLAALFSQHNEHRIFFDRFIVLIYYKIFGNVNFVALSFIGGLSLLAISAVLFRSLNIFKKNALYFIPVIFLVFNYKFCEVTYWAMASLQNLWVIAFAFISLSLLYKDDTKNFVIALSMAILATFTSGNGLMTFLVGIFVLAINKQINYKFFIWSFVFVICSLLYFYDYIRPPGHPDIAQSFIKDPLDFFSYCFVFMGSVVGNSVPPAFITGILISLMVLFLFIKKYHQKSPAVFSFIVFLLLTTCANAVTRFGFGIEQAQSLRYVLHSILFLVCLYIAVLELYGEKILAVTIFATSMTIFTLYLHVSSYQIYATTCAIRKDVFRQQTALMEKGLYAGFDYGWPKFNKQAPLRNLKMADSLGIFKFQYKEKRPEVQHLPLRKDTTMVFAIDRFENNDDTTLSITGWALLPNLDSTLMFPVINLYSEDGQLVRQTFCDQMYRWDVAKAWEQNSLSAYRSGFTVEIPVKDLQRGKYNIAILLTDNKTVAIKKTDNYFQK
jgi:hypothetical protein